MGAKIVDEFDKELALIELEACGKNAAQYVPDIRPGTVGNAMQMNVIHSLDIFADSAR